MSSAVPGGKKAALCRYFVSTGTCTYGDECQFLHQNPHTFQQQPQQPSIPNSFLNGPTLQNGPTNTTDNLGMPVQDSTGSNGDQFFNATFSGADNAPEFQPFSQRPGPISRQNRSSVGMVGNGSMMSNSPMSQANNTIPQQPQQIASPFNNSSMTPNKAPISQSTPLSQQQAVLPPPQNGPVSSLMNNGQLPPNMKPFMGNSSGYDSSMTSEFSALNLSIPSTTKGGNPMVSEFIPKLSHSSSSPNFSSFNNMPPPGHQPPNTSATNHLGGLNITSSSSPNHSPRLSPNNSPLMMRRTGSPVAPLRQPKPAAGNMVQENVGGTTYFYNAEDFTPQREGIQLPNFTMFHGPPPHIAHMKVKSNMPQFFMPDELKVEILNKSAVTMAQIDLGQNIDIPAEVDTYRNLFPLEPPPDNPHHKSKTFGYPTTCYKALNTKDGQTYCLRRIHGFRLVHTKCMTLVDMWKKMFHPNIVQLREVFTTKAFGDHSIVFVYDFYPLAETLLLKHFSHAHHNSHHNPFMDSSARPFSAGKGNSSRGGTSGPRQHAGLLPESLIWSYVVQLSSSLRAIHAAGLSCRTLDPSKIIIYNKSRLRLNCCGIFDVLTFDNNQSNPMALTPHYQEDLISLGKVVLALACNSVMAIQRDNLQTSMELVARNYSADLKNLILYLLGNQNRPRSINDIMPMIGARFYTQLDSAQLRSDVIETELAKEVENGRLFRLLCKLGVINERPEFNLDPQWSETGDRYMLKLFRDYVFHQVDENGAPWVDMSHIVMCLNKLDAGSPEKISLMSRDEQNILVVSYAELKQCFENSFGDILNSAHTSGIS
ncbi:PAN2-PAN3 deadenylation complex subunit pan3-like isoform X2 [Ruditapes philippinarum]|uniref:PAN2-PAN3 deadenylation complex subunit pan3-like isoform X2 n=1 Tax=Ruditapes philippinarum TaxID=129788 RepID=UPI00295BB443|nr:PAN2-PAN3 deadenylation complex subunit pan3-like isoform X2 [Ruditapes philippinarum]